MTDDSSPITQTRMLFTNQNLSPLGGIRDCGYIKNSLGIQGDPRILGAYALVLIAHGHGRYEDEQRSVDLGAGDLVMVFPDVPHRYAPAAGSSYDTLHVIFEGQIFDAWRQAGLISPDRPVVTLRPVEQWPTRFEQMLGSGNGGVPERSVEEVVNLQRFLQDVGLAQQAGVASEWSQEAQRLMTIHKDAHAAAAAMGMSYERFRKRFSTVVGMSPDRFTASATMDMACQMLATSDDTVRVVAHRLGFYDEFHFSRRFKEIVGVAPSMFRARYR